MNKGEGFPRKVGDWTELSSEIVYDNPWIEVRHSHVLNPNGGKGIYGVVHFKNIAIGVIPVDNNGNTYLVGQERFPFNGKYTWEIIEGGGPLHINPIESAKRELLEEAGIVAKEWKLIQEMDLSNSATTEIAMIYLATDLSFTESNPEETEKLAIRKLSFEEAYKEVLDGKIKDSLSVAGLLKANTIL